ncbi:hypothetical protein TWF106_001713 [Orbilia oligospora]|uniref:Uncharacterized protein n=1 Tax=Orbilia oligospora TaxID=2813651 RepID=A0A7C8UW66_ORBOL|nr:hypothetical protein TWF106_001713 [Orbilia oligospora]
MHSVISTVALAFLGCASSVYGHALIIQAHGDANVKQDGRGLGFRPEVHKNGRHGHYLHPFQLDSVIFKDPLIPCCGRHRTYSEQGCGLTLFEMWRKDMQPHRHLADLGWGDGRVQNFMHTQRGYKLNIPEEMDTLIAANLIPQASAGGWLKMRIHQVNEDGAGPFKCKLDQSGLASAFGAWMPLSKNLAGNGHSINHHTSRRGDLWLELPLPKDLKCSGTYGKYKNICMVRCENQAVNGPFGGCVPFQQMGAEEPTPTPTPEPTEPEPTKSEPTAPNPSTVVSIKTVYKDRPRPTGGRPRPSKGQRPTSTPKAPTEPKEDNNGPPEDIGYY